MTLRLPQSVKHLARLALRPDYRARHQELERLRRLPRYTPTQTNLLGRPFAVPDSLSFLAMYRDIIEREVYRFPARSAEPLVIDGGANIGVSVAYFKRLYPQSRVIAFEPDPAVFQTLRDNCASLQLDGVELVARALWSADTELAFEPEGADAGRVVGRGADGCIRVPAARLKSYLAGRHVDLLKLDIEGAETEVLEDCRDALGDVDRVVVEYHSFEGKPQSLPGLLGILAKAGFRLHVRESIVAAQPFVSRAAYRGMDLLLVVFAFRE